MRKNAIRMPCFWLSESPGRPRELFREPWTALGVPMAGPGAPRGGQNRPQDGLKRAPRRPQDASISRTPSCFFNLGRQDLQKLPRTAPGRVFDRPLETQDRFCTVFLYRFFILSPTNHFATSFLMIGGKASIRYSNRTKYLDAFLRLFQGFSVFSALNIHGQAGKHVLSGAVVLLAY